MNLAEYRIETTRTLPNLALREVDGEFIRITDDEAGRRLDLCHMALGLATEIAELTKCVGTELRLKGVDKTNLGEEIGDIYWYLANYANMRDLDLPEDVSTEIENYECLDFLIERIGALVDIVKRQIAYDKAIEKVKEMEAVYDILAGLFLLEQLYDLNGNQIRATNIAKLRKRFPKKFEAQLAIDRDVAAERNTLEQGLNTKGDESSQQH